MSSGQQQIWYLLVQADGAAFENSAADIVYVPHDALIVHLRDAVKAKNDGILPHVVASQLKVFKNKSELRGEPIDEETPVSGLGEAGQNKKDALFVVVPDRISSSLLANSLPKLGDRDISVSVSKTRKESAYGIQIVTQIGTFGVLDDFSREKLDHSAKSLLWTEAVAGTLKPWSGENSIQRVVQHALMDSLNLHPDLAADLNIYTETTFSISRIMAKHQDRVDVTTMVKETRSIAGVCEVKLPGFNMDSLYQIVDYMVDLRNSFNVRFVFGILTTYEKWRILWFGDTNTAAQESSREKYDDLCNAGTANDYTIDSKGKVDVYMSRVYTFSEVELVETLVSVLYKIRMTPIATPQKFIEPHKKYVRAQKTSFTYSSLPSTIKSFSYQMPPSNCHDFYILQYYHRGGDGRVAICCSKSGNLCVLKFLLERDGEKDAVQKEANLWNRLWSTKCFVVELKDRFGLIMPFCLHIRSRSNERFFCGLEDWNRLVASAKFADHEVTDAARLNREKFDMYQKTPRIAAEEALARMAECGVKHDDFKWAHVALLPTFSTASDSVDLVPVLLDLTRTTDCVVLDISTTLAEIQI